MSPSLLVTRDDAFLELLARARGAPEIALDCEFHGEKRYRPTLYLLQLRMDEEVAAVDPRRVDLKPLASVLEASGIRKLLHAGREDVRLLARATGARQIDGVFDTQVAAAFLGRGLSIGYAKLVKELLGVDLDKSNQFTDWSGALTPAQIEYALNDVRYLPRVAELLHAELEERGRLDWALDACRAATRAALTDPDPRLLYRKISGFARLTPEALGRLRELAMWRDSVAESENCRPESVVSDPGLRQLALEPPRKHGQLRGTRGVGIGGSERWWSGLNDAIARGTAEPEPLPEAIEPDPRAESIALLLGVVRRAVAIEQDLAPELLASTGELRALAEWRLAGTSAQPPELDVLSGWRRGVAGESLLAMLSSTLTVGVEPGTRSGIALGRR